MPSILELLALVALALLVLSATYIAHLELRIVVLGDLLEATKATAAHEHNAKQLPGEHEALQGAYKTSQDTIRGLCATKETLKSKVALLEILPTLSPADDDRPVLHRSIDKLQRRLDETTSQLSRLQSTCNDKTYRIGTLLSGQKKLLATTDLDRAEIGNFQRKISEQATIIGQRDAGVAKFDALKEFIHRMTETGGHYMVWTVLFVGLLAYVGNFDLAELGIDRLKFESYFEYARALAAGLQCPLRPQDGFRLKDVQYPLTGLRTVGTRVVTPTNIFLAHTFPPSLSPPVEGFNTVAAQDSSLPEAPKASMPTHQPAPWVPTAARASPAQLQGRKTQRRNVRLLNGRK